VRRQRTVENVSRDRALAEWSAFRAELQSGRAIEGPLTLRQFVARFYDVIAARHEESTRRTQRNIIKNHLLRYFGDTDLNGITTVRVIDLMADMRNRNCSAAYINDAVRLLKMLLRQAVERDVIADYPIKKRVPREKEPPLRLELRADERARFSRRLTTRQRSAVTSIRSGSSVPGRRAATSTRRGGSAAGSVGVAKRQGGTTSDSVSCASFSSSWWRPGCGIRAISGTCGGNRSSLRQASFAFSCRRRSLRRRYLSPALAGRRSWSAARGDRTRPSTYSSMRPASDIRRRGFGGRSHSRRHWRRLPAASDPTTSGTRSGAGSRASP
jgi:hypothetical protein